MENHLLKLQNGSDIRGIAMDSPGKTINLGQQEIRAIARGILRWLKKTETQNSNGIRIAIGMDSRVTGEAIKGWMIEELVDLGVSVMDCKMATTPAMFMTTVLEEYSCHCGVMITASHMPYYYNGIKLFSKHGAAEKQDITQVLTDAWELMEAETPETSKGQIKEMNLLEDYSKIIVQQIIKKTCMSKPFEGMNIIVDAGNGAGGFFAHKVLDNLGANTKGSQFLEPDGMFPNHEPNPENKQAMESISSAVLKHGADLGIIFDTDVDRAAVVADDGMEINRNNLIALASAIVLEENPETVIVTDSITSDGLKQFIEKRGGIHHRFNRGYKNVINESKRINEEGKLRSCLAIETSGHAALEENYFLDDGSYLVSKILVEVAKLNQEGKKIQSLIQDLAQPVESREYRIKIKAQDFQGYGQRVLTDFALFANNQEGWSLAEPNYEGVKVNFPCGWLLLRMSLHEPNMPLNIESDQEGMVDQIMEMLQGFIKEYHEITI